MADQNENRLIRGAIWALPCAEQEAELAHRIRLLAASYGGPVFLPHLTVVSGQFPRVASESDLRSWSEGWNEFELPVLGIEHHAEFFRCVVAVCEATDKFYEGWGRLREAAGIRPYELYPHVSLFYGNLPETQRERICSAARLGFRKIRFDRLAFVYPQTGRWEDLEHWKLFATIALDRAAAP